jgi:hypothetical protein
MEDVGMIASGEAVHKDYKSEFEEPYVEEAKFSSNITKDSSLIDPRSVCLFLHCGCNMEMWIPRSD